MYFPPPRWLGWLLLAAVLLLLYLPVFTVMAWSFNDASSGAAWRGFTWRWYGALWTSDLGPSLRLSVLVGAAASTGSVALGLAAALALRRWPRPLAGWAEGLLTLPLAAPDMILAIALALFFLTLGARQGLVTVILAHTAFGTSYAFVVLRAAVADLDETLVDAALDCGATPWQAFWRVLAPLLAPSLTAAWLVVFALSFDDYLITYFTKGPGADTLPIKIFGQLRFGVKPTANALFTLLFLGTLATVPLILWLGRGRALGWLENAPRRAP